MARGGKRKGTPGTTYSNRTDLNKPNFDGGYGDDTTQAPLKKNLAPARGVDMNDVKATARSAQTARAASLGVAPRAVTPLDAPDDRPDEPVTAGLPLGAGPGPEAIGLGGNPTRLSKYLPALEVAASAPGSSMQLRQFVRILRGGIGGPAGPMGPQGPLRQIDLPVDAGRSGGHEPTLMDRSIDHILAMQMNQSPVPIPQRAGAGGPRPAQRIERDG